MKNVTKIGVIAALTVVSFGMLAAMADARGGHDGKHGMRGGFERAIPSFAELDVNADGQITADDLAARRDARFAEIDADADGVVSRDEFLAHAARQSAERAGEMFDRLDADGDGGLSRDVLERGRGGEIASRMIDRADQDGDGGISEDEYAQAIERLSERGQRMRDGGRGH